MSEHSRLLYQKQMSGSLIEVWQQNDRRWLSIDDIEQTRINIEHPDQLLSQLHQAILASLLFIEVPRKVLLAGLGGGELARYLHHMNPEIQGDVVEISETITQISRQYFNFPDAQWNINIRNFQQWRGHQYDLMVVDIAETDRTPDWLTDKKMLLQLKQQLSERGVLAMNLLVDDVASLSQTLMNMREVFKCRTLCLSVPQYKNIVVFAFNRQPDYRSLHALNSRIIELAEFWKLDFSCLLKRLVKDNPVGSGIL